MHRAGVRVTLQKPPRPCYVGRLKYKGGWISIMNNTIWGGKASVRSLPGDTILSRRPHPRDRTRCGATSALPFECSGEEASTVRTRRLQTPKIYLSWTEAVREQTMPHSEQTGPRVAAESSGGHFLFGRPSRSRRLPGAEEAGDHVTTSSPHTPSGRRWRHCFEDRLRVVTWRPRGPPLPRFPDQIGGKFSAKFSGSIGL